MAPGLPKGESNTQAPAFLPPPLLPGVPQVISSANYRTGGDANDFMHGFLNYQVIRCVFLARFSFCVPGSERWVLTRTCRACVHRWSTTSGRRFLCSRTSAPSPNSPPYARATACLTSRSPFLRGSGRPLISWLAGPRCGLFLTGPLLVHVN